jgi:hypothetical protein
VLKNTRFWRSVVTEMPPIAMSHLPAAKSGTRFAQLVLTSLELRADRRCERLRQVDVDALIAAVGLQEAEWLVVAWRAGAQNAGLHHGRRE